MTNQQLPPGRYGKRATRKAPKWVYPLLLSLVLLLGLGIAVVGFRNLGTQPIEADQASFAVLDDHRVQLTIEVQRDASERPAVCVVRARSQDGDESGRRELYVPPASGTAHYGTVLHTSKRPVTGEVFGCSYTVPQYLSSNTRPSG